MTVEYDSTVIETFAAAALDRDLAFGGLFLGVVLGLAAGLSFGRARAFKLKLEAQVALCQVQIERNTERTPEAS